MIESLSPNSEGGCSRLNVANDPSGTTSATHASEELRYGRTPMSYETQVLSTNEAMVASLIAMLLCRSRHKRLVRWLVWSME